MECPKCRSENPPSAIKCDCGFTFVKASLGSDREPLTSILRQPRVIRFIWVLPLLGAFLATGELLVVLESVNGAPQEAAGAGIALAFVVIPYCLAQSVIGLMG